ncbi:MAG: hypothetical protein AB7I38_00205 [Dehalococcoidia bacterium]
MPSKRPAPPFSEEQLALYDALLAHWPEVERRGASMPYTSLNGNMYSFLGADGLALRLPRDAREAFLHGYDTRLYEANGAVMKEYVAVPDALLRDTTALRPHFEVSYAYVQTLRPKPTTRRKTP